MFIPQAKPNEPARAGVNRTVVVSNAGSAALTPKSANTTRDVQSPLSWRSNSNSSGTPCRTRIRSGLYPPATRTVTRCTPSDSSAADALRGPKKNQPSPPIPATATIRTTTSATFTVCSLTTLRETLGQRTRLR